MCGLNVLLEMEITLMEIVILMLDCENVLLVAEFYLIDREHFCRVKIFSASEQILMGEVF